MSDDGKGNEKNDDLLDASNVTEDKGEQKVMEELCELKLSVTTPSSSAPTTTSQDPTTSSSDTVTTSSQLSSGIHIYAEAHAIPWRDGAMHFTGDQSSMQRPLGEPANTSPSFFSQLQDTAAGRASPGSPTHNVERNNNSNSNNSAYWAKHVLTIMPTFWQHDPKLWFDMLDSEFSSCKIIEDHVKYHILLKSLGNSICVTLSSVLHSLPEEEKYDKLKAYLIKKYSKTLQQKIDTLMKECKLGSRKPSELFAEMEALGQGHVPRTSTLFLWYRLLPNELAIQLDDAITGLDAASAIEKAARIQQRLKLLDGPAIAAVSDTTRTEDAVIERVTNKVIAALSTKTEARSSRSSSKEQKPPRSRHYHHRFDDKAKKCNDPSCAMAHLVKPLN
uniref:DUF7041 domain-containing protein n=1 Tax=Trichogramma kaykai TaxID=54128 RepID=A0ABD2WE94_9HYME